MVYADYAIKNINDTIRIIDLIMDNLKFKEYYQEANRLVNNSVHAILDWYERMDKSQLSQEEDTLLRAFMYLNNQIKHDINLEYVSFAVSGSSYPMFYPFRYGLPGLFWRNFPDNGRENSRGKRCHYEEALMDKDVKKSLLTVKSLLEKENH